MKKNRGQTLVEYALILVLVAAGVVLSLVNLGSEVLSALNQTSETLAAGGVIGNPGPDD